MFLTTRSIWTPSSWDKRKHRRIFPERFGNGQRFVPSAVLVGRGRCFVHFVWASGVVRPDGVKTRTLPVSWLTVLHHIRVTATSITPSNSLSPCQSEKKNCCGKLISMLSSCDVCHLYRWKKTEFFFLRSFCTRVDRVGSCFVKIFVNL